MEVHPSTQPEEHKVASPTQSKCTLCVGSYNKGHGGSLGGCQGGEIIITIIKIYHALMFSTALCWFFFAKGGGGADILCRHLMWAPSVGINPLRALPPRREGYDNKSDNGWGRGVLGGPRFDPLWPIGHLGYFPILGDGLGPGAWMIFGAFKKSC